MHRLSGLVLFTLIAGGACDPTDAGAVKTADKVDKVDKADKADKAATAATPAARSDKTGDAPAVAASSDFAGCLLGCDAAKLSHAEKATCRYNCEGPGKPVVADALPAAGADPVGYVVSCMDRCASDGKQSVACTSACKTAASGLPASPSGAVLDELTTCVDTCRAAKHVNETNHATCTLNCAQTARVAGPAKTVAAKSP